MRRSIGPGARLRRRGAAAGGGIGQLGAWGGPVPSFAARIAPRGRLELQDVPASVPLPGCCTDEQKGPDHALLRRSECTIFSVEPLCEMFPG